MDRPNFGDLWRSFPAIDKLKGRDEADPLCPLREFELLLMGGSILRDASWISIDDELRFGRSRVINAGENPARPTNSELDLDWSVNHNSAPNRIAQDVVGCLVGSSEVIRVKHAGETNPNQEPAAIRQERRCVNG